LIVSPIIWAQNYGLSQKIVCHSTEYRKCQSVDLDSFVKMKYLVFFLIVLGGCQITPRYHNRGFQVSLRNNYSVNPSSKESVTQGKLYLGSRKIQSSMSVVTDRCADTAWGEIRASHVMPTIQLETKVLAQRNIGNRFVPQLDLGVRQQRAITAQFNRVNRNEPPKKHSVFKPTDREDWLELGSILCYAVGLLLVLLSWAMASEIVFTIGAFLLAGGLAFCLVLGFNQITHTFSGYMSVLTILGAIYLLVRFGFLDELLSVLKI
jgi:hypothetical protein